MKKELLSQLSVILPLTAIILLALLVWRAPAASWFCIEIGGSQYCFDDGEE